MADSSATTGTAKSEPHRAGAFDIRVFIGSMLGLYGVILVIVAVANADGRKINLLAGLGMVVFAVLFLLWARLRPVVVPDHVPDADAPGEGRPSAG